MKKKILSLVLALVLVLPLVPVFELSAYADDDAIESPIIPVTPTVSKSGKTGDCTWTLQGTVLTISGSGAMEDYIGATEYPDLWGKGITKVIVKEGVTSIGNHAFVDCKELVQVELPDSLISIGYGAFNGCEKLSEIKFGPNLTTIDEFAFCNCSSLTEITIPDSVTEIGWSAFNGCTALTSLSIGDALAIIDINTFFWLYEFDHVEAW